MRKAAVAAEALPPAQVAADLVAKDRASGRGATVRGPAGGQLGGGHAGAAAGALRESGDLATGPGGAAGGLVVVDAARRVVAKPGDGAPWQDAGHRAAIVALAPRWTMRAA
ncbi:hypothetical protein [Azospirillum canadense]|uniref:hypothetical protein n=1 Tax=Azospirillum canadense TaxID=403962 RepID=UPI002225B7C2|nr:hypothetical protein [Azospirillum canadense]MCW2240790.1 hypothetical protein [Azospirillum canadense]